MTNLIPFTLIVLIAIGTAYTIFPPPVKLGEKRLDRLMGRTPRKNVLERLLELPRQVKEDFRALERTEPTMLLKLAGACLGLLAGAITTVLFVPPSAAPVSLTVFGAAGYLAPDFIHKRKVAARKEAIEKEMVFFLGFLRAFCKLGNLYQALQLAVAGESGRLARELETTLSQVALGEELFEALREAADRIAVDTFSELVFTLEQSQQVGAPLDEAVAAVEEHMYRTWETDAHSQVARMDFRLTVLGVVVLMPALLLTAVFPALMQIMRQIR